MLHDIQDERVWFALCEATWAGDTDVRRWLPPGGAPPCRARLRPPANSRDLFRMLRAVEGLRGLWRVIGEGPAGALISFEWTRDGLEGHEVQYHDLHEAPDRSAAHRFCPRRGLSTAVEWGANGQTVTLKEYRARAAGDSMRRAPSADLVAEVGFGGTPQSSIALGSSPQGSFEQAWLEFMHSSVAQSARQRRRSSRCGTPGSAGPALHHLRRVDRPRPTPKHPLAGMWAACYGAAGVQVVRLAYDFSGRAARITAEKVTGDSGVPAGQRAWVASAAAMPQPWPPADERRIAAWQEQDEAEAAAALGELDGLILFEDGDGDVDGMNGQLDDMDGVVPMAAAPAPAPAAQREQRRVVSVHAGSGQVAEPGYELPQWVEGRLWVHADGTLSFYWLDAARQVVALRQIDGDLPPR